jgi:hypothetical protein
MSSEVFRYLAGGGIVTVCGYAAHVISLRMRLRFNRYVIDKAAAQGQPINPVEIIDAANPKSPAERLMSLVWLRNWPGSATLGKPSALPPPEEDPPGLCSNR